MLMSHTVKLFERIVNHMLRTIVELGNTHFVYLGEDDLLQDPSGVYAESRRAVLRTADCVPGRAFVT